jgi:flagellar P-ring protein precursor FlgI
LLAALVLGQPVDGGVRIKDITDLQGARKNQLVGFGLVTGLDGTGSRGPFTQQVAVDMLQRLDVRARTAAESRGSSVFRSGNISAVMITAELGPFNRKGSTIDVVVSALDDATSLKDGILILTPLKGADGVAYAVAQGPVSVGGAFAFTASGGVGTPSATAQKNHPTVGRIEGGAIVEHEARGEVVCNGQLRLMLRDPDHQTARTIALAVNSRFANAAVSLDAGSVQVFIPRDRATDVVTFAAELGLLEVTPDAPARVVINERTGTIVAGEHVKIARVAVSHGNLAIVTGDEPVISQPNPFARGTTVVVPVPRIGVTEEKGAVRLLEQSVTVADVARALNALKVAPRDLIAIFQALKKAGALHAELVIM